MDDKNFSVWDLEKHQTKDTTDSHINGELTVVWRDWDNIIKNHPKMIYVNNINPQKNIPDTSNPNILMSYDIILVHQVIRLKKPVVRKVSYLI